MAPTETDEYGLEGGRPRWHVVAGVAVPTVLVAGAVIIAANGDDGVDTVTSPTADTLSSSTTVAGDLFDAAQSSAVTVDDARPTEVSTSTVTATDVPTTVPGSVPTGGSVTSTTSDDVTSSTDVPAGTVPTNVASPTNTNAPGATAAATTVPSSDPTTTVSAATTSPATTLPPAVAADLDVELDIGLGIEIIMSTDDQASWVRDEIELEFLDAESLDLDPPAGLRVEIRSTELTGVVELPWPADSDLLTWFVEPYIELTDVAITISALESTPGTSSPVCFAETGICLVED